MAQDRLMQPSMNAIIRWLYLCAASVFCMALIGAVTRLTESGLSMVEWRPLVGALPPLSEAEWTRVFDLYKQTSEYQLAHDWMGIDDFKRIFFWEWFHRLWGRMIGVIYAVPFFYFLLKNRIPVGFKTPLWILLVLGSCQGLMGWYMVQSGFVDRVDVSHYRLAAHLGLAFVIFAGLVLIAQKMSFVAQGYKGKAADALFKARSVIGLKLVAVTILYGAFVAGLNAGLVYNSFPFMGAMPWPSEGLDMSPLYINFVENHATVQFVHRLLAVSFVAYMIYLWARIRCVPEVSTGLKFWMKCAAILAIVQACLGVATLLTAVSMPLAVLHQAGAFLILGSLVKVYGYVRYTP